MARLRLSLALALPAAQAFVAHPTTHVSGVGRRHRPLAAQTLSDVAAPAPASSAASPKSANPVFEYLKFDGAPTFDVMAKTIDYTDALARGDAVDESTYAADYVLRGPVIGPITRADLAASQNGLGLRAAFPHLRITSFGHTIDPENPYRCFFFQRWRAVHEQDLDAYGDVYPATGTEAEMPVSVFSLSWNPAGEIAYEQVGAVVDRLEGNTAGKAAVFGLLHTAGLKIPASPGDKVFQILQRLGHFAGNMGRSWSREKDIPRWWVSPSRGADNTEQW